jgi:hypothetical protein
MKLIALAVALALSGAAYAQTSSSSPNSSASGAPTGAGTGSGTTGMQGTAGTNVTGSADSKQGSPAGSNSSQADYNASLKDGSAPAGPNNGTNRTPQGK